MKDIPRQTALQVLNAVSQKPHSHLDQIISHVLDDSGPDLSDRDRKFVNVLIFGVLRHRETLDWIIRQFSKTRLKKIDPDILNILRVGLYQIFFLDRVPDSAAVNTAVGLAKKTAPPYVVKFVNGVLRNAARQPDILASGKMASDPAAALSISQSFPLWLVNRWTARFGTDACRRLLAALNTIPPITVRCNTLKTARGDLASILTPHVRDLDLTAFAPDGIRFNGPEKPVQELEAFKQGYFQVQDEAAQLVTCLLDPRPGEYILDACAGLGGKTGHLAQLMANTGQLVAADRDAKKLAQLQTAMNRLGITNVCLQPRDFEQPAPEPAPLQFDRILLDAPCSGTGVIRRNPDIKWNTSLSRLEHCAAIQGRILENAGRLLKPGGILVYVVCSIEPEETEQIIDCFLNTHPEFRSAPLPGSLPFDPCSFTGRDGYFRTLPHLHDMDGFFAARLERVP